MTKENEKLRNCLRDAESIITNALRSQPEGDDECKRHLTNAVKEVLGLVYEAKSQMPDGSKYAMEGMGHPSAHDRPSNTAAMREALELFAHMNDDGFYDKSPVVRSIVNKARAALAAPPRNCDLPEVAEGQPIDLAEQAWRVYKRFHKDSYLDAYGLLRCIGWLLAPATKQKGENNGSK